MNCGFRTVLARRVGISIRMALSWDTMTSPDGQRHGFIARPVGDTAAQVEDLPVVPAASTHYIFESIDVPGVEFLELTASSDFWRLRW